MCPLSCELAKRHFLLQRADDFKLYEFQIHVFSFLAKTTRTNDVKMTALLYRFLEYTVLAKIKGDRLVSFASAFSQFTTSLPSRKLTDRVIKSKHKLGQNWEP